MVEAARLLRGEAIGLEFEIRDDVYLDEPTDVQLVKSSKGPEPRAWIVVRSSSLLGVVVAPSAHMSVETLTSLGADPAPPSESWQPTSIDP